MSAVGREQIEAALAEVEDKYLGSDLMSARVIKNIEINDANVVLTLQLGYPANGYEDELRSEITKKLDSISGIEHSQVDFIYKIEAHSVQKTAKGMANVKNTIAVASGKGGVGKSTTAINLAMALQVEGANVGILDADIYGPSQPRMLGSKGRPNSSDGKTMEPNVSYKVQSMSIGYLINEEDPMIWRGPMATSALTQLITDTNWHESGLPYY